MAAATTAVSGYLTSTDWNTFNNKGSGTVTAVSVVSANGFNGSSSGGATPALTLTTTITGLLKGNATAISAAAAGTDYSAGTAALATGLLKSTTTTGVLSIASAADIPLVGPRQEAATATAAQTVFNTTMTTTANAAARTYLMVYVNGVKQIEGDSYTVTGANQITFGTGLLVGARVELIGYV